MIMLPARYLEEKMKTIEISIRLDPVEDGIRRMPKEEKMEGKHALVIGTNGKYRVIEEEETISLIDRLLGNLRIDYMGKSAFLVVYNASKVIVTGEGEYIAGSVLVIKADKNGIALLDTEEIEAAKVEFAARLVTLCADGVDFSAYEIG